MIVLIIQRHVRKVQNRENCIKFQQELRRQQEEYIRESYYEITKIPYHTLLYDNTSTGRGRYGEYLTYTYLKSFEANGGKFLFNLYIPKGHDQTTEIDILLICSKGIFCFESKNYSGWIFGNEYQKNWCQTLPQWNRKSHKEYFNNP
ncbi:MAG: NERD domain-containing protein, partial [Oscillospiraceae bacterium]|nr:NERD domain-containing protein [Oscillospiraceae bacterium]